MPARGWSDASSGRPLLQVFKASDYQGSGQVNAAAQDRDGVLYFGGDGIIAYDGATWRHCAIGNNLGVRGLAIDEQGRILGRGHRRSRLLRKRFDGESCTTCRSSPCFLPNIATNLWFGRGGHSAGDRLLRRQQDHSVGWKSFTIWPLPEARQASSQRISDAVYITHPETGLWKLEGDQPVLAVPSTLCSNKFPAFLSRWAAIAFLAVTPSDLARSMARR